MSTPDLNTETSMEGPSGVDLNPAPPDPTRLSKRAGLLFLLVIFIVFGLIIFGIYQRGHQHLPTDTRREETRNMTAATDAGRQIASRVPERLISNSGRELEIDEDLKAPPEPNKQQIRPAAGNAAVAPSAQPYNPETTQHYQEPTPEERRLAELYQRELAALDAPTGTAAISNLAAVQAGVAAREPGAADTLALLQAMHPTNSAESATTVPASVLQRGLFGGANSSPSEEYQLQNMQDQKEGFLLSVRKKAMDNYLPTTRVARISQFVIRAGWDIPAVLEQGINSDLPGEIRALVRENVYDTASGQYLLIPQGARLVGRFNSQVGYGQNGLQVVWDRILFPDASSIDLSGMNGQDATGRSGFRYGVDTHYVRMVGFGLLTSILGAAAQLSQNQNSSVLAYPSNGQIAASAVGQQMATLGAETTRRNLNVQPTIRIPVGYRFNVRVNRDLAFEGPYRPLSASRNTESRRGQH
jgi:type IV secretory pathway VirB10-like protein